MSKPPPDNLLQWSKPALAREVNRLRAITREHAERTHGDARLEATPTVVDVAGDPFARGGVILDARGAVLLDSMDVSLVDLKQEDAPPALAMALKGRVNYSTDRSETLYLLNDDGAAAIISQLVGLAQRIGPEFADRLMVRLEDLPTPPEAGS